MDIDVAQILVSAFVSLLVGAASAWIGAKVGVRRALEQIRGERAFDRRLDWYEKTVEGFNNFKLVMKQHFQLPVRPEQLQLFAPELTAAAVKLRPCIDGAVIYAKRETLAQMRTLFVELDETTHLAEGPEVREEDLRRKHNAIIDIMDRITFELAKSIREQLDLDEITPQEFKWEVSR